MTLGSGGPIVGRAIIQALGRDQEAAASAHEAEISQAALDEADLRELERAEYYREPPAESPPAPPAPRRSLIDRLLGR